jgi:Uri superfamily endonuclease
MAKTAWHFTEALRHPGCYSLIIALKREITIRVGKLGTAVFPSGTYVYTGSAMKGLGARLKRHRAKTKKSHWHIDYLLTLPEARVRQVILYPAAPRSGVPPKPTDRCTPRRHGCPEKFRGVRL